MLQTIASSIATMVIIASEFKSRYNPDNKHLRKWCSIVQVVSIIVLLVFLFITR